MRGVGTLPECAYVPSKSDLPHPVGGAVSSKQSFQVSTHIFSSFFVNFASCVAVTGKLVALAIPDVVGTLLLTQTVFFNICNERNGRETISE